MYARARFWMPCSSTRFRSTVRSDRAETQEMILSHPCDANYAPRNKALTMEVPQGSPLSGLQVHGSAR